MILNHKMESSAFDGGHDNSREITGPYQRRKPQRPLPPSHSCTNQRPPSDSSIVCPRPDSVGLDCEWPSLDWIPCLAGPMTNPHRRPRRRELGIERRLWIAMPLAVEAAVVALGREGPIRCHECSGKPA